MNARFRFLSFLIVHCVLLLLTNTELLGNDPQEILTRIRKKYDKLEDVSISYTQSIIFSVTKNEQSSGGKFWMKKGNKYRIESEDQTIITDNKTVWSYSKSGKQVYVENYKEDPKALTPERILVNVPKQSAATILGKEKINNKETTILKLVPKEEVAEKGSHLISSNWKWIKMWIDENEWLTRKIQVLDRSDNLLTYSLDEMTTNSKLEDRFFQFQNLPDVEVIDLR